MPFSTDHSWPAGLLKVFKVCREVNRPLENRYYYGPCDKLINYCFGDSFTFFVAPQRHPPDNNATKEATAFLVFFLILFDALRRPVLIAKVNDDSWASNPKLRLEADEQLRRRYNKLWHDIFTYERILVRTLQNCMRDVDSSNDSLVAACSTQLSQCAIGFVNRLQCYIAKEDNGFASLVLPVCKATFEGYGLRGLNE